VRYEIIFSPDAARDLGRLSARDRSTIRDMIAKHLRHEPEKVSRSRIKRLRGFQ
jgi:mRNA-degrading endonuclease RelE of RelBE toxin-antitoxin system